MTLPRNFHPRVTGPGRMLTVATPESWTEQGFCATPQGVRWSETNASDYDNDKATPEMAAELCAGCPVIQQCLEAALVEEAGASARGRYLIRGGMTPAQRAAVEAERKGAAA